MSQPQVGIRSTIAHDSLFGWVNIFKRIDSRYLYKQGERPPYPIIVDNPNVGQVLSNLNRADFGAVLTLSFIGFFAARGVSKFAGTEYVRQRLFDTAWSTITAFGVLFGIQNSYMRLQGFSENGLRWRRKDESLRKYDFSSEFESQSIFKYFRIRDK